MPPQPLRGMEDTYASASRVCASDSEDLREKDTKVDRGAGVRITVEMVLKAYKETGLKPMQGDLFPAAGCACGLGAYAAMNGYEKTETGSTMHALLFLNNLTSNDYVNAFGDGFDGDKYHMYGPEYDDAFRDGQEAWEAVKHLADPELLETK